MPPNLFYSFLFSKVLKNKLVAETRCRVARGSLCFVDRRRMGGVNEKVAQSKREE
jgi:hypothetical protein